MTRDELARTILKWANENNTGFVLITCKQVADEGGVQSDWSLVGNVGDENNERDEMILFLQEALRQAYAAAPRTIPLEALPVS